jgi:hypothetical protein
MADFSFTPAAAGIKPVPQTSLADMVNVARGAQAYQQAQQVNPLEVQKAQTELQRIQALTPLEIERGEIATRVARSTETPTIAKAGSEAETAGVVTESAKLKFAQEKMSGIASRMTSVINDPIIVKAENDPQFAATNKTEINRIISNYGREQAKELGIPSDQADRLIAPYLTIANESPQGMRRYLMGRLLTGLDNASRVSAMQPSGIAVSTGAGGATVQTGMYGAVPPGTALPGTTFVSQLPPTTQAVAQEGDSTGLPVGTPYFIGPQATTPSAAPKVASGLAPQTSAVLSGAGAVSTSDWADTAKRGSEAGPRIAVFENIKKLVPGSFTGVGGQNKQFLSGLAQAIGIDANVLESSNTDELSKNTKILALAGGNTDAARSIAELANPNTKMTKEGILRVTDQLMSIEKLAQAKSKFLAPFSTNAAQYAVKTQQFNQINDPRIFQEMSREEVAKLKASLSPAQYQELSNKIKLAKQLGVI